MNTRSLLIGSLALLFVACSGTDQAPVTKKDTMPPVIPVAVETVKETDDKMERTINAYADLVCMVADPNFWEGFWDDEDKNGWRTVTDEDGDEDDAQFQAFLNSYGFSTQEELEASVAQYKGLMGFVAGVVTAIKERCPGLVTDEQMDDIVEQLQK